MKTDTLFYRLFQTDPSLALELAGVDIPEAARYRFVAHEVKEALIKSLPPPLRGGGLGRGF